MIWYEGNNTSAQNISGNWSKPFSLFPTTNEEIYIDDGSSYNRVDKWNVRQSVAMPVMYVCSPCYDLFVSVSNFLYCSMHDDHQVVAKHLSNVLSPFTIVAGKGIAGSTSSMFNYPNGIFVDTNQDLYVTDCFNHRVQRFPLGQLDGITAVGSAAPGTIALQCPTAIVVDADKYFFIVDHFNHRIVGSGSNGFRCVCGCSGGSGAAANQLLFPISLSFDSYGNIYVADRGNNRIQKFILATNSCGMYDNIGLKNEKKKILDKDI